MTKPTQDFINETYKILKFQRDIDKISGQEIGVIEVKALDGGLQYITVDDNVADEIEKDLYKYIKE